MLALATVTAPLTIGLIAWWAVMLAAPVVFVMRWRRRRGAQRQLPRSLKRVRGRVRPGRAGVTNHSQTATTAQPSESDIDAQSRFGPGVAVDLSAEDGKAATASAAGFDTGRSATSRWTTRRLPPDALEPLCRYIDFQRRLELAASELRTRLARLPASRWRIEPYPLTGERRNTFVILGETGIFVVSATYAPGHWDDVIAVSRLAGKIQVLLPGYGGQVRPAICHPFSATEPRIWHRPDEHGEWVGAWLVGGDSVAGWLLRFGCEHGLSAGDLVLFDDLARPNWLKGAIPTAPSWPPEPRVARGGPS
jgi:hypothetical protein